MSSKPSNEIPHSVPFLTVGTSFLRCLRVSIEPGPSVSEVLHIRDHSQCCPPCGLTLEHGRPLWPSENSDLVGPGDITIGHPASGDADLGLALCDFKHLQDVGLANDTIFNPGREQRGRLLTNSLDQSVDDGLEVEIDIELFGECPDRSRGVDIESNDKGYNLSVGFRLRCCPRG